METAETVETPRARRIVIIGPTGAGKTTVGQALAARLGWRFVDLDAVIEAEAGASAAGIFAVEGVEGFRRREADALAAMLVSSEVVIAAGAGLVETPAAFALARERAWVVAIDLPPQAALERIIAQASALGTPVSRLRPMLSGDDPLARLHDLYERRKPLYDTADDVVLVDALEPDQVAARIIAGRVVGGVATRAGDDLTAVRVEVGAGYDAVIGWGALAQAPDLLATLRLSPRLSIVTDSSVGALYAEPLMRRLRAAGWEPEALTVPAGETSKSREWLAAIHDWLAERRVERGEALLALGGGVVGDLAGFAAATWLRGIPLIQIPTSLLAQVDASIGGKVAIDHPRGKNLIGAFHQPRLVMTDTAALTTLPARQRVEGWAEVIKHGVALDAAYFAEIERDVDALLAVRAGEVTAAVARSVAIKGGVVAGDEREREGGRRALLNFGHTLGHAIETVTDYSAWLHGEAVSAGMVFAARLGQRMGVTPGAVVERLEALLVAFGLPTRLDGLSAPALMRAALWDKKARGGRVRWALLTGLGESALYGAAPEDAVRQTLLELGAYADEATPGVD